MSKKYNNKYWEYSFFSRFIINYYLISNKLFIYIYISIFIYIITNIKMIDKVESSIDIWIEEFISTTMFKIFVIKYTDVREKKDWREKCYNYNIFSCSSLHLFELIHKFHQFQSPYKFSLSIQWKAFLELLLNSNSFFLCLYFFLKKNTQLEQIQIYYYNIRSNFTLQFLFIYIYLWQFPGW